MKLYEIPHAYAELYERLADEPAPEDWDELLALDQALEHKAENICKLIHQAEAEGKAIYEEMSRLHRRARSRLALAKRLEQYLLDNMKAMNIGKIQVGVLGNVTVIKNSQPTIRWDMAAGPPPYGFQRVKVEADLAAAQQVLRDGKTLPPGFIVEQGSHLRIG